MPGGWVRHTAAVRLFAAVPVPEQVRDAVTVRLADVRDESRLRWVRPEHLHVTLAFYGDVPDGRVDALAARLARAAGRVAPLRLRLGGPGTFGRPQAARVLWLTIDGDVEALRRLAASARACGRRVGLSGDALRPEHRYRAHLTLARADPPADVRALLDRLQPAEPASWTAEQAHLVRSDLGRGPGGSAAHTVIAALALRSDAR